MSDTISMTSLDFHLFVSCTHRRLSRILLIPLPQPALHWRGTSLWWSRPLWRQLRWESRLKVSKTRYASDITCCSWSQIWILKSYFTLEMVVRKISRWPDSSSVLEVTDDNKYYYKVICFHYFAKICCSWKWSFHNWASLAHSSPGTIHLVYIDGECIQYFSNS